MGTLKAAVVGVSGIGRYHRTIMHELEDVELVAAVEKYPEREKVAEHVEAVREWGVPLFDDIIPMLDEYADELDYVTLAVPHHWHAPYAIECLNRDIHVLVEKPVTILAQDGWDIVKLAAEKDLHVAVDFQYTSYPHSHQLKEFIADGGLGELTDVIGVMQWKRTDEYYDRGHWTGKRYADGLPVWDGVMMNQAVHLINTCLQMGSRVEDHAMPRAVQAELYQAHPHIEVEDLAALRADLGEATMHFYCTTNCDQRYRTDLDIFGTKGRAEWDTDKAVVYLNDADEDDEPIVFEEPTDRDEIHRNLIAAIRGETKTLHAPAEEAVKATLLIDGAYASAGRIQQVPWTEMAGINWLMDYCAEQRKLFSEVLDWPYATDAVEITEDFRFDGLEDD
ncbi:MAG: Gfo/Idh/MocA family oxidoreductase [Armatimonadota bacterium]